MSQKFHINGLRFKIGDHIKIHNRHGLEPNQSNWRPKETMKPKLAHIVINDLHLCEHPIGRENACGYMSISAARSRARELRRRFPRSRIRVVTGACPAPGIQFQF